MYFQFKRLNDSPLIAPMGAPEDNTIPFLKTHFEDSRKCATNLFYPIKRSNVFYTVHAPLLTKKLPSGWPRQSSVAERLQIGFRHRDGGVPHGFRYDSGCISQW